MAFGEIKARLGLDISPFEKGMAKAHKSVGGIGEKITSLAGKILGPIAAVSSLATAFTAAFYSARELRDEAELMGMEVSAATEALASQADTLDEVWSNTKNTFQELAGWAIKLFAAAKDNYRYFKEGHFLAGTSRKEYLDIVENTRERFANERKITQETERRDRAARSAIISEIRSKQLAEDIARMKKQLGITEDAIKETQKEEASIVKKIEESSKAIASTDDDRLTAARERLAALQQEGAILRSNLQVAMQQYQAARSQAANPQGLTTQDLAGMNPYDSRFGFSLTARRRIQQAQQSLGLREQARFAEVGGNASRADRLLGQANSLESSALGFRNPDRNRAVQEIAKQVADIRKNINSIKSSLELMEIDE